MISEISWKHKHKHKKHLFEEHAWEQPQELESSPIANEENIVAADQALSINTSFAGTICRGGNGPDV